MRKLLLASAATVGMVGSAVAQAPAPAAAPLPTEMLGIPSAPTTYLGGNNSLNQDGGPMAQGPMTPTPGTMVVHLNGRVWAYAGFQGGTGNLIGGDKLAPMQWVGYFRLYPGVDAMATNGLRYGAIVEIRQNFIGQSYGLSITPTGTNVNAGAGSNYSSSPSGSSSASTLYVRREAVYFGSNQLGIIRIGQDDGPFSQFDNGVTTFQFGTGAWNGDAPDSMPGGGYLTFPFWSGIGAEYTPSKGVYFSPRFAGFDFAASFAPNNAPNNAAGCAVSASGCAAVSTAVNNNFGGENRPTNWYEFMGRYQGSFGGLGVYGIFGYSGSGHVNVTGATPGGIGVGGLPGAATYTGFDTWDGGLALTYAGFTVGGNVLWGSFNNQVQLKPDGVGSPNAVAWVGGAQYAIGPWTFDASYLNYQYQGALIGGKNLSQRYDDGLAVGMQYAVAPGMTAYAEYLYGQEHQGGVSIITGGASPFNNNVHEQSLVIGTRIQW